LRYSPETNGDMEFALLLKNITDEDIREPSQVAGNIVNDLPRAGRHALAELRYKW
jgi:hypothetical protein